MSTVAETVDAVIGGDTHVDTTSLAVMTPAGAVTGEITIDNDPEGYQQAIAWIWWAVPSGRVVIGLEGTRSYGAGLCRALQHAGLTVVEVERPSRGERGRRGKSDAGDAVLAARKTLAMSVDRIPQPRTGDGVPEALRLLTVHREQLSTTRTRRINLLLSILLTGDDDQHRIRRGSLTAQVLTDLARRPRGRKNDTVDERVRRALIADLARDIQRLDRELADNLTQLKDLVESVAPQLLQQCGVGPVTAAQAIVSYSHHGRCRNEAAFAALAGVNPIPASSGRITRYRLNRGGDRRLNRALHTIELARSRCDERTRDYIAAHRGTKTDREIRRLLKRYIAREIFKILQAAPALAPTHHNTNKINNAA